MTNLATSPASPVLSSSRTRRRFGVAALAFAIVASVAVISPEAAYADPAIDVHPTTTTSVLPNSTTTLTGLGAISELDPQTYPTLQVTITTTVGTISIPTNTNLTLAFDNNWSGDSSITFTGDQADVTAAVASTQLVTTSGDTGNTASVSLTATFPQSGFVYSPANQHFYQYVADPGITWDQADNAAQGMNFEGQQGYLATISSDAINDFISNRLAGAQNAWIGAESMDAPTFSPARTWQWSAGGPLAGDPISYCTNFTGTCDFSNNTGLYSHWADGEPNNFGATSGVAHSGEYVAVTNWGGSSGEWNDLPSDWPNVSSINGFVVEYGDHVVGSTGFSHVYNTSSSVFIARPPSAPTGVSATRGDHSAVVSFTAPATYGAPITHYMVTTNPGGATTSCSGSPCTVTGLTNGTGYTFTVTATSAYGTGAASSASAPVVPAGGPAPLTAPRSLRVYPGDRVLTLRFTPPISDGGSPITAYGVSLDGGRHWLTAVSGSVLTASVRGVRTAGASSRRTLSVSGVLDGRNYQVQLRAVDADGPGAATGVVKVATTSWFHDPIGVTSRRHERKVPAHPDRYHGKLRWTTARARAHDGALAMPVASLRGRQLQPGQAASLGMNVLFAFDSARLSRAGRAAVKSLVQSLRYDKSVMCEGYTDYAGRAAHERSLSLRRARAVCAALNHYGAHVHLRTHGYGAAHPVIVGGRPSQRAANRRVIVLVTG